jgi:uncharacterized protein YhbP (UPF0306 family)
MTNEEKARKIVSDNLCLTLATANSVGEPWIANVYYAYDGKYNFYWYSAKDALHSNMIVENGNVAISIFNSNVKGSDMDAVYMKAKAIEVTDRGELVSGLTLYAKRMLTSGVLTDMGAMQRFASQSNNFMGVAKLRLYKAIPVQVWKMSAPGTDDYKFAGARVEVSLV